MNVQDPAIGGYFRMPNEWLELEISPGAKVLLAYFCSMARDHGTVFPSFRKCGAIVGRSRSSVCAYVRELVEIGYVTTQGSIRKDGANSVLTISIVGWKDIVARMSRRKSASRTDAVPAKADNRAPTMPQQTERAIQPTERNYPSGNISTNNLNNTPPSPFAAQVAAVIAGAEPKSVWSMKDEAEWANFRPNRRNPAYQHGPLPRPEVIERLKAHVAFLEVQTGILNPAAMKAHIEARTQEFCIARRLHSDPVKVTAFCDAVRSKCPSVGEVDHVFNALSQQWQSSWRNLSTPAQVHATYDASGASVCRPKGTLAANLLEYRGRLIDLDTILRMISRQSPDAPEMREAQGALAAA